MDLPYGVGAGEGRACLVRMPCAGAQVEGQGPEWITWHVHLSRAAWQCAPRRVQSRVTMELLFARPSAGSPRTQARSERCQPLNINSPLRRANLPHVSRSGGAAADANAYVLPGLLSPVHTRWEFMSRLCESEVNLRGRASVFRSRLGVRAARSGSARHAALSASCSPERTLSAGLGELGRRSCVMPPGCGAWALAGTAGMACEAKPRAGPLRVPSARRPDGVAARWDARGAVLRARGGGR